MTPIFFKRVEQLTNGGTVTTNALVPRTFWRLWHRLFPPQFLPWQ